MRKKEISEKKRFQEAYLIECDKANNQWYIKYREQFAPITDIELEKL